MVTIVDYDTGNLRSVMNALDRLGAGYRLSRNAAEISQAERVLLPGVGAAAPAMARLREYGLADTLQHLRQPVLGICLGLQLLCSHSEEGDTPCLGIFPNRVRRFEADPSQGIKVPHMGWNTIARLRSPLFDGVAGDSYVYYVHSYFAEADEHTLAVTEHTLPFSGALGRDNYFGCQFHPEKSGPVGEQILSNFLKL